VLRKYFYIIKGNKNDRWCHIVRNVHAPVKDEM